jgi:hypothetical protein
MLCADIHYTLKLGISTSEITTKGFFRDFIRALIFCATIMLLLFSFRMFLHLTYRG